MLASRRRRARRSSRYATALPWPRLGLASISPWTSPLTSPLPCPLPFVQVLRAKVVSLSAADGKPVADPSAAAAPDVGAAQTRKPEASSSEQKGSPPPLTVLWDVDSCPLPLDPNQGKGTAGGAMASNLATASVSRRFESIAGWRASVGPVSVYGNFTDEGEAATRDQAFRQAGFALNHGADPAERVGAMLTALMLHVLDRPSAATLIVTDQRSVLEGAIQLATRGFGVSVALPEDFSVEWLPPKDRALLLRGLYCWPQLRRFPLDADEALTALREKLEEAEDKMQSAVDADDFEAAAKQQELVQKLTEEIARKASSAPTPTDSSRAEGDQKETTGTATSGAGPGEVSVKQAAKPPEEAVEEESDDPVAKMIRQARALGDTALVAKLQAIGS